MDCSSMKEFLDNIGMLGTCRICIHDISGILSFPPIALPHESNIHCSAFCVLAKQTPSGFNTCIRCKHYSNKRALLHGRPFTGTCAFGMTETVYPVEIDGKTRCILYLGGWVKDQKKSLEKLENICRVTGNNHYAMRELLLGCTDDMTDERALSLCRMTASYLTLLYETNKGNFPEKENPYHWAVSAIKRYIDDNYRQNLTLSDICRLYFINEKYAGQLFKAQIGQSFHRYLNSVRLKKASELIQNGDWKIIDVALLCGFNNVTYFNRKFFECYGVSPGEYRKNAEKVLRIHTND